MSPVGFEPTIPASERLETHALDRTATGVGSYNDLIYYKLLTSLQSQVLGILSELHNVQACGIYCENSSFESFRDFIMLYL